MFHVPLHRKIAAAGAPTLDDVRDNPSTYSWTGPAYHKLVLFSDTGEDFDGNSLGLTLNGCNYKTGVGGGLEQPGSATPAIATPALEFFTATANSSLIVFYTLNVAWPNHSEIIDYLNRTSYLRSGGADVVRLLGNGMGSQNVICAECRTTTGVMHNIGLTYDQSLAHTDRTRMFVNSAFNILGSGPASGTSWPFQDFGGDTLGDAGPASVIHMIIGFQATLSDQNMIDIMNNPASFFS